MTPPPAQQIAGPARIDPLEPRLLLVSYHFPPGAAVGGLRWLRFASHAAEFGWAIDVITAHPDVVLRDEARLTELPPTTRVFGVRPRATILDRWRSWRRRQTSSRGSKPTATPALKEAGTNPSVVPVADLRWSLHSPTGWRRMARIWAHIVTERAWSDPATIAGLEIAGTAPYDAIISSGPPHFAHLAAVEIGRQLGRPVVLDFRDPWSTMRAALPQLASPLWPLVNRRLEKVALTGARLAVFNTLPATEAMRTRYPSWASRFLTVMNGVDDEPASVAPRRERFLIAYAGNIYIDRNPRTLFRAAKQVIADLTLSPEQFGIEFMGHADRLEGRTVEEIAAETGVAPFFRQHPAGPRQEAVRFLGAATVLVSLPQSTPLAIPSKAFEYLAFEAWPLLLASEESATEQLFRGTSIPVIAPNDETAIAAVIKDRYLRFAAGERPGPQPERDRFGRRAQATTLFQAIRALTDRPVGAS